MRITLDRQLDPKSSAQHKISLFFLTLGFCRSRRGETLGPVGQGTLGPVGKGTLGPTVFEGETRLGQTHLFRQMVALGAPWLAPLCRVSTALAKMDGRSPNMCVPKLYFRGPGAILQKLKSSPHSQTREANLRPAWPSQARPATPNLCMVDPRKAPCPWPLVPGPRSLAFCPWPLVPRPLSLVPCPSLLVPGPSSLGPCPWPLLPRPLGLVPGPLSLALCPLLLVTGLVPQNGFWP